MCALGPQIPPPSEPAELGGYHSEDTSGLGEMADPRCPCHGPCTGHEAVKSTCFTPCHCGPHIDPWWFTALTHRCPADSLQVTERETREKQRGGQDGETGRLTGRGSGGKEESQVISHKVGTGPLRAGVSCGLC